MSKTTNDFMTELSRLSKNTDLCLLSDDNSPCVIKEWLPTGSVVLDAIMGGGLPSGRFTEIYGESSSGKSLIAAQCVAKLQKDDPESIAVYIDTEHAVSLPIMKAVGVDITNVIISSPSRIEDVFTLIDKAVALKRQKGSKAKLLIVWDSIAATSITQEEENEFGKATMGRHAQLISQGMRKLTSVISDERVFCLFLNQTREKIGVMFGDNTATFGGKAVGFHATIRVSLTNSSKIKEGNRTVGAWTQAVVVKNKAAVPFMKAKFPIYFGNGINDEEAIYEYLKLSGKLEGQNYTTIPSLPEIEKFQRKNWAKVLEANYAKIVELVKNIDGTDIDLEKETEE